MEELNKKLAEWAGWRQTKVSSERPVALAYTDLEGRETGFVPGFTESLDACFKWLVPKLTGYKIEGHSNGMVIVGAYDYSKGFKNGYAEAKTPALALCLAISKLIDKV